MQYSTEGTGTFFVYTMDGSGTILLDGTWQLPLPQPTAFELQYWSCRCFSSLFTPCDAVIQCVKCTAVPSGVQKCVQHAVAKCRHRMLYTLVQSLDGEIYQELYLVPGTGNIKY
jgi:hypothetical protein